MAHGIWFLQNVRDCLEGTNGFGWSFILDEHKVSYIYAICENITDCVMFIFVCPTT